MAIYLVLKAHGSPWLLLRGLFGASAAQIVGLGFGLVKIPRDRSVITYIHIRFSPYFHNKLPHWACFLSINFNNCKFR